LEREGLVQISPGRAITVAALSMQEVMDVVHLRYLLEPEVARLAARLMNSRMQKTLNQTVEHMKKAAEDDDRAGWSRLDTHYHEVMADACSNKLLGKMALQMRNRVHYIINEPQTALSRIQTCTDEHRIVAEAIGEGDADLAENAMRDHMEKLRSSLFERFAHL
jgi:DNA-binding GntR family transcriptional regulator